LLSRIDQQSKETRLISFNERTNVPTFDSVKELAMQWTTPAYTDLRLGFEITMYVANR
jgi:coenzyme PQQ precursor peptide PqqA